LTTIFIIDYNRFNRLVVAALAVWYSSTRRSRKVFIRPS